MEKHLLTIKTKTMRTKKKDELSVALHKGTAITIR